MEFTEVFYQMAVRERYPIPTLQLMGIIAGTKIQPYEQICISISLHLCKLIDLRHYMQANKIQIVQLHQVLKKTVNEVLLKKTFSFLKNSLK